MKTNTSAEEEHVIMVLKRMEGEDLRKLFETRKRSDKYGGVHKVVL